MSPSRADADAAPPIHVVAGVLGDARGRILLARREGARELAGLWEFPGGKVEPGESAVAALARELHEELGVEIDTDACTALIAVPHRMGNGKRIVLDVYRVSRFSGRARGMEAQAVAWVQPARLGGYSMPGADRPVVAALRDPELCLIDAESAPLDADRLARLARALEAGARRAVLDVPAVSSADVDALAALARRHGAVIHLARRALPAELIPGLARRGGLGLHLGPDELEQGAAGLRPAGLPLSASCAGAAHLARAQDAVDFALLTEAAVSLASGTAQFSRLREAVTLPIYACGNAADLATARGCGAQGIAMAPALWPG